MIHAIAHLQRAVGDVRVREIAAREEGEDSHAAVRFEIALQG